MIEAVSEIPIIQNKYPNDSRKLDEGRMRGHFAICGDCHGTAHENVSKLIPPQIELAAL